MSFSRQMSSAVVPLIVGGTIVGTGAILVLFKSCFGTFSISQILKNYEDRKKKEQLYNRKFQQREALVYHISWAKVVTKSYNNRSL